MNTPQDRAIAAIERHRHGMHPPLWRALRDLVESKTDLAADHSDLLVEIAEKSEGTLSWDADQVLGAELALTQWLAAGALTALGHSPVVRPTDAESARSAASGILSLSVSARSERSASGDSRNLFYGSGIKGAMELIFQFPGPRPTDPLHGEIARVAKSFGSDLARGGDAELHALRGGFLRTLAGAL